MKVFITFDTDRYRQTLPLTVEATDYESAYAEAREVVLSRGPVRRFIGAEAFPDESE